MTGSEPRAPLRLHSSRIRVLFIVLSASLLLGSICLAAGVVTAAVYTPQDSWNEDVGGAAGGVYVLAVLGSLVACLLSLVATILSSRTAALPAVLLLATGTFLAFLVTVLLLGFLLETGQLPPIIPPRPSAFVL